MELPEEGREAFVLRMTAGRAELETLVRRWLHADSASQGFLEEPIRLSPSSLGLMLGPGAQLGPYRLIGQIGEGGMGTVFAARQEDETFSREVAVKFLSFVAATPSGRARFHSERRILAALEHRYIARVLDGGTTESGIPFLVMERIEGLPIDRFCRERALGLRERLRLFQKVCAAVRFSHQNLVIHRDLKPSNILVTDEGTPKLLDFGIAELLDAEGSGTSEGEPARSRLLTPQYASPEQLLGERVTTASDVYSLGVLLFELLAGTLPYDSRGLSPAELQKWLASDRTPLASTKVASGHRASKLRGDLDSIAARALRADPRDRYPSVERLSEDVTHYLENRPVDARRGGLGYRLGKLLRRNRLAAALTVAALASLIAFNSVVLLFNQDLRQEREKQRKVSSFFVGIFERAAPVVVGGQDVTVLEALDEGSARIDTELADAPEARGEVLEVLGTIYLQLGRTERSLELSRQALDLSRSLFGEDSPESAARQDAVGEALRELHRFDEAEVLTRRALEWYTAHPEADPEARIRNLNNWVTLSCQRQRCGEVDDASSKALSLAEIHLDGGSPEAIVALSQRAVILHSAGRDEAAEELYRSALERIEEQFGQDHPFLADLYNNLGSLYLGRGDRARASASYVKAEGQYARSFGVSYHERAKPLLGLALIAEGESRPEDARELNRTALEIALPSGNVESTLRAALGLAVDANDATRCRESEVLIASSLEALAGLATSDDRYHQLAAYHADCLVTLGQLAGRQP